MAAALPTELDVALEKIGALARRGRRLAVANETTELAMLFQCIKALIEPHIVQIAEAYADGYAALAPVDADAEAIWRLSELALAEQRVIGDTTINAKISGRLEEIEARSTYSLGVDSGS
jgi:hypothetical protein